MEELSDELDVKVALNALASSCLFHFRASCFFDKTFVCICNYVSVTCKHTSHIKQVSSFNNISLITQLTQRY